MSNTTGVDGVSNAMISAIWAVDLFLEAAKYGIHHVYMNVDTINTMESPFGPAPDYTPQPMYYAMLLMSIIQQDSNPRFLTPNVVSAGSASIKVHAILSGDIVSLVLINKDINTNATGTVFVNSTNHDPIRCLYLTGTSLSSKTVSLAGYTFAAGNATPQGNFSEVSFPNQNGNGYNINLAHAEIAYCRMLTPSLSIPTRVSLLLW